MPSANSSLPSEMEGGQELKPNSVSFGKVGDWIKGTYVGVKKVTANEKTTNLYEITGIAGQYTPIENSFDENGQKVSKLLAPVKVNPGEYYSIWGGKSAIDDGFKKAKFGEIVGVMFKEASPSKKAGHSPFKIMMVKSFGMDPNYMGDSSDAKMLSDAGVNEDDLPPGV